MAYNSIAVRLGRCAARAGSAITEIAKIMTRPAADNVIKAADTLRAARGH
jgi:hypothetical protein